MPLVDYQVRCKGRSVLLYATLCRWSRSWSGAVVQMAADDEVTLAVFPKIDGVECHQEIKSVSGR